MKEFTCDASSAAADLARARNLSVRAASQCPLRSEGTEAGYVAAKGWRCVNCDLNLPNPFRRMAAIGEKFNRWNIRLYTGVTFRRTLTKPREVTMKRVLIAVATVGALAPAAWVTEANAQYGAPAPAYSAAPAYGPSQTYAPSRKYARRAYRRSARAPRPSGGNLVYTPGSGPPPYDVPRQVYASQSSGPWEWHAAPGPNKRGNMCITHTDPMRGYGFQGQCKK